jgi:FAD/FMN-containing dehydrogenase
MKLCQISGWGRYPRVEAQCYRLEESTLWQAPFITQGHARSYGDAALGERIVSALPLNRLIAFDEQTGLLTAEAGVLLAEIIEVFLPRGWFLKVTPGTKLITLGGAVASDVHGKNHHLMGCFSESVESFRLRLSPREEVTCSRSENSDLFHATCGGMGLTGIITQVSLYLKPVQSQWIEQMTFKTANLDETFAVFEAEQASPYSVAWIDCLAQGAALGRSLVMTGDFAQDGDLAYQPPKPLSLPFDFPAFSLNHWSVKAFNALYYAKATDGTSEQRVSLDSFFYPLDAIGHWNRIYGKGGFTQFQCILPKAVSLEGMREILAAIAAQGQGSFLAVLKLYGPQNANWLSFPLEGYSLALDFKMTAALPAFIRALTDQVVALGGRVYLAKDALLTPEQLAASYPRLAAFKALRQAHGLDTQFHSHLSCRLGI